MDFDFKNKEFYLPCVVNKRYGKQASGTYGFVDNLTISYSGNRIAGVSDGAPVVTQNGSMDFPGGSTSSLFSYNAFGALTADPSRGITSITYDNFGNPVLIQFSNGRSITNVYSSTGEKLKTSNQVGVLAPADAGSPFDVEMGLESASSEDALAPQAVVAQSSISYHGPIIYRNSTVDKVLFPGGYATISGSTVTFHYYTQDYLGNNRAVINGTTGATEQTVAYYPFGAVIADLGTPTTGQPYKFGGKELLTTNGLNEYDFGARNYYSAVPSFTKPDLLCEKYPWISPYLYCINNPVNAFDPDGNIVIFVNGMHKGDGGKPEYWNGLDDDIKNKLNDRNAKYIDGSFGGVINTIINFRSFLIRHDMSNISAKNRIMLGYIIGLVEAKNIYSKLSSNETIAIITHSMGAAAAKGFAKALIEYANKQGFDPRIIFELDLAPFEWWDQKGNSDIPTYTISHWYDIVAGPSFMKNAKNFRSHDNKNYIHPFDEHSIDSFRNDAIDVLDGIIKGMKSGEIKVYLDGKRIN